MSYYGLISNFKGVIEEVTIDYPLSEEEYVPISLSAEFKGKKVRNGRDAAALMREMLPSNDKEYFIAAYLDCRNNLIKAEIISVGSINASIVHPREVFKPAIINSAASIILMHNHPSGDPMPSEEDISITRKLVETGRIMGISVLDHVIIGTEPCFYSLAEEGLI